MTVAFPETPASAEDLLDTGLLNNWYNICKSTDVSSKPLGLKRLNQNIVLWRDTEGKLNVVEDYCPHRGAALSLGSVHEGRICCAYHGLELNGEGVITATPAMPDSPFVGEKAVKGYPCQEAAGAVFVWFGDERHQEPAELYLPEELTSDEWSHFQVNAVWNCNYQVALDNRVDPMHGSYLHSDTYTLFGGKKEARIRIKDTGHGFILERENQVGINIDRSEVQRYEGNFFWVKTEVPLPKAAGGGMFRINGYPTPIDRNSSYVILYRAQKSSGWKRDMWRFLYKNRLEDHHFFLIEQDRVMLEQIPLEARQREMLLQTDTPVARLRRMLSQEAESQFAESQGRLNTA